MNKFNVHKNNKMSTFCYSSQESFQSLDFDSSESIDSDSSQELSESENEQDVIGFLPQGSVIEYDESMQYFEGLDEEKTIQMMKYFVDYYYLLPTDSYGSIPFAWETAHMLGTTHCEIFVPFVQSWNNYVLGNGESTLRITKVYGNWSAEFGYGHGHGSLVEVNLSDVEINELLRLVVDVGFNPHIGVEVD
jgi:hypothetical protein